MVHLSHETLSDLLDGNPGPGAEEHLASCPACQGELEALRTLSTELRELPPLNPPADLWSRIEARLPYGRRERRLSWPSLVALQAAAMAAVFVLGLALGRAFEPGGAAEGRTVPAAGGVATEPEATGTTSLADALAEVRRLGSEYDAALANLERLAQQEGAPVRSSLAR
ncbi:MAG: hypothetical protein GWN32_15390, partial [Gemmatimonadetes bacterium]|nr:hypothetical protein [Gemmatimonadota bacterium]